MTGVMSVSVLVSVSAISRSMIVVPVTRVCVVSDPPFYFGVLVFPAAVEGGEGGTIGSRIRYRIRVIQSSLELGMNIIPFPVSSLILVFDVTIIELLNKARACNLVRLGRFGVDISRCLLFIHHLLFLGSRMQLGGLADAHVRIDRVSIMVSVPLMISMPMTMVLLIVAVVVLMLVVVSVPELRPSSESTSPSTSTSARSHSHPHSRGHTRIKSEPTEIEGTGRRESGCPH